MKQFYSNDSLTAYNSEEGIYIEEKKKGSIKMLLALLGLSVLVLIGGFTIGLFGGKIGLILAPFLIWGAVIVLAVSLIAFLLKFAIQSDTKITFNTIKNQLSLRGKVFPFSDVEKITEQEQRMMGKTMVFVFIHINGKKKSLFSTAITVSDPIEFKSLILNLNEVIQKGKN